MTVMQTGNLLVTLFAYNVKSKAGQPGPVAKRIQKMHAATILEKLLDIRNHTCKKWFTAFLTTVGS